jgi:hypothetical protein
MFRYTHFIKPKHLIFPNGGSNSNDLSQEYVSVSNFRKDRCRRPRLPTRFHVKLKMVVGRGLEVVPQ